MGQANIGLPGGIWNASGNVGIGTLNPSQKLTVNGTIHAKQVIIVMSIPVPEYVFDKDYKLRPLTDLRNYIVVNKHLPEIPSANELEKKGINVTEINMKLLQKVEELTFYLIEKDKQLAEQKQLINKQGEGSKAIEQHLNITSENQ